MRVGAMRPGSSFNMGTSSGATVRTLTGTGMFGGICAVAGKEAITPAARVAMLNVTAALRNILCSMLESWDANWMCGRRISKISPSWQVPCAPHLGLLEIECLR